MLHCKHHHVRLFDYSANALQPDLRCIICEIERADRAEAALVPFAHPDLCKPVAGQTEPDAPVYGRDKALLRRSDFTRARDIVGTKKS